MVDPDPELAELYIAGMTLRELSERVGRSIGYVYRRLLVSGVEMRKPGQGMVVRERQPPAECGTVAGHGRHVRNGEKPCDACRDARNAYNREWKKKRRTSRRTRW